MAKVQFSNGQIVDIGTDNPTQAQIEEVAGKLGIGAGTGGAPTPTQPTGAMGVVHDVASPFLSGFATLKGLGTSIESLAMKGVSAGAGAVGAKGVQETTKSFADQLDAENKQLKESGMSFGALGTETPQYISNKHAYYGIADGLSKDINMGSYLLGGEGFVKDALSFSAAAGVSGYEKGLSEGKGVGGALLEGSKDAIGMSMGMGLLHVLGNMAGGIGNMLAKSDAMKALAKEATNLAENVYAYIPETVRGAAANAGKDISEYVGTQFGRRYNATKEAFNQWKGKVMDTAHTTIKKQVDQNSFVQATAEKYANEEQRAFQLKSQKYADVYDKGYTATPDAIKSRLADSEALLNKIESTGGSSAELQRQIDRTKQVLGIDGGATGIPTSKGMAPIKMQGGKEAPSKVDISKLDTLYFDREKSSTPAVQASIDALARAGYDDIKSTFRGMGEEGKALISKLDEAKAAHEQYINTRDGALQSVFKDGGTPLKIMKSITSKEELLDPAEVEKFYSTIGEEGKSKFQDLVYNHILDSAQISKGKYNPDLIESSLNKFEKSGVLDAQRAADLGDFAELARGDFPKFLGAIKSKLDPTGAAQQAGEKASTDLAKGEPIQKLVDSKEWSSIATQITESGSPEQLKAIAQHLTDEERKTVGALAWGKKLDQAWVQSKGTYDMKSLVESLNRMKGKKEMFDLFFSKDQKQALSQLETTLENMQTMGEASLKGTTIYHAVGTVLSLAMSHSPGSSAVYHAGKAVSGAVGKETGKMSKAEVLTMLRQAKGNIPEGLWTKLSKMIKSRGAEQLLVNVPEKAITNNSAE